MKMIERRAQNGEPIYWVSVLGDNRWWDYFLVSKERAEKFSSSFGSTYVYDHFWGKWRRLRDGKITATGIWNHWR